MRNDNPHDEIGSHKVDPAKLTVPKKPIEGPPEIVSPASDEAQPPTANAESMTVEAANDTPPQPAEDTAQRVHRSAFPHPPRSANKAVPATLENFAYLLNWYGIVVLFNVVKKRVDVRIPGVRPTHQNRDEAVLAHLESLAVLNDMSPANVRRYLLTIADSNPYDPFAEWIQSRSWDGVTRMAKLLATITPADDYPPAFAAVLVRKWLLSILAATFRTKGFRARGVLTLQGDQGIGKTSWFARLVSDPVLRDDVIKLGYSWDGGSKDARLIALRHRIVELGELEGSFRKEVASLKSFITETTDKIRPPYGRVEAEYPRSTIFAASVNDPQFLIDATGNSRFWTIPVKAIDYEHDVDMQQLLAELKVDLDAGAQWWLTPEEEAQLATINARHSVTTAIEARLLDELDLDRVGQPNLKMMTAREVLAALGLERPTNAQFKEANSALRNLLGPSKRSRGVNRWPIPWLAEDDPRRSEVDDSDLY